MSDNEEETKEETKEIDQCTHEVKKQIKTKHQEIVTENNPYYNGFTGGLYMIMAIVFIVIYILSIVITKGLDLPYILKRGEFLWKNDKPLAPGQKEGYAEVGQLIPTIFTFIYGPRLSSK